MSKHTPGPWIVVKIAPDLSSGDQLIHIRSTKTLREITSLMADSLEIEANANLMASAPELLEALILAKNALVAIYPEGSVHDDSWCASKRILPILRAAIAKAEGK